MTKKIYIGITIVAIVGLALYFYNQKKPTSSEPIAPSSPTKSSGGLSIKQKKDWITANAKKVYGIEKNFSMEKLSDSELTALYVMGAAMSKYGKVMAQTAENFKKVKDDFGVDISTTQFKTDAMNAMLKLA
jgi:hypothetical protein